MTYLQAFNMDLKSVLVLDDVEEDCAGILRSHSINVTTIPNITHEELLKEIQNHDAIVVRSTTRVTKELLHASPRLKLIGLAGIKFDNIDVSAARNLGITILHTPGADVMSMCELNCMLTLALKWKVVPAAATVKAGLWDNTQFAPSQLICKTLAIIGLSDIGSEVAQRMHAFGMQIIGYDPYVSAKKCAEFHVKKVKLEEVWPVADYIITLHTPFLNIKKKFINANVLENCKRGVKIVNVGRGDLINYRDFLDALQSGQVGGAALDIIGEEFPVDPVLIKIIQHPAVIATPNHGSSTKDALKRSAQCLAQQFINLTNPGTFAVRFSQVF